MRHHFVPRGGCHHRLRLGKSAIAAPTLDDIIVVRAQGSTLTRVHPEISRTIRSHLAVMHTLGVPSLLTCPRDPPSRHRSCSHLTTVRTSRGRYRVHLRGTLPRSCPAGSTATAAATSPSCAPHGAATTCVPSGSDAAATPTSPPCAPQGGHRCALASGIRRRERVPSDPPSRACSMIHHRVRFSGWGCNCRRR
jgi:hypothetical protein